MRAHLKSLAAAGVGGVLTYCSAPTVATIDPSRAAVKEGLVAAAGGSATTTAAAGRQLLQQQQARATAATATTATTPASTSSIRVVPAERPTNASALANLVAQAAVLGMGVGFVVPEYRHRNARSVRDDLRWCLEVAQGAVRGSAQARGALAARPPAARRAQPLAPLLSHEGRAVFLVRSAASIPCHHWTALLKPGGAFSVREREVGAGAGKERAKRMEAAAKEGLAKRKRKGEASEATDPAASAVAGAGAVSQRRSLLASSTSSSSRSSSTASATTTRTTVKNAFSSSSSSSSSQQQQQEALQPRSPQSSSSSAASSPVSLDGFWLAEWKDRDDGDVAASCGFDGVATAPGGDDASDASSAENDRVEPVPFGADPGNWPAMRARRQGLAFLATVSPGSDATPVRPWSASKVSFLLSFFFFLLFSSFCLSHRGPFPKKKGEKT